MREVLYNDRWHMCDPDYRTCYLLSDGTGASGENVKQNPELVLTRTDAGNFLSKEKEAGLFIQIFPVMEEQNIREHVKLRKILF